MTFVSGFMRIQKTHVSGLFGTWIQKMKTSPSNKPYKLPVNPRSPSLSWVLKRENSVTEAIWHCLAELIRRVAATGKTTVVVLIGGSAVVMSEWQDQVPAVLNAWYPGVEGGNAVADVLFGDYNPSGKLPITYPIHEAQLPLNYSHKPTGRSDDYLNLTGEPLFPFGHGLSYSEFDYSGLKVTKAVHGTAFHVTFSVKNTGKYAANEVVQLYLRDQVASVTQPIMRLIHFQPVSLAPRETKELHFTVNEKDLSMLDKELNRVIEPGDFRLMIGRSCKDIRLKTTLTINHPMTLETNH